MRNNLTGILLMASFVLGDPGKKVDAQVFINDLTARISPIAKGMALNYWEATATGKKELYARQGELELEMRKVFADAKGFKQAKAFRSDASITSPTLKRQIELIYLSYLENQMEPKLMEQMVTMASAIEGKFNTHRGEFEGKRVTDNVLLEVLKTEKDQVRRKAAWEAAKSVGESVAADLIKLVKIRNEGARQLGFKNYYEMRMALNEQDPGEIARIFADLAEVTEAPFALIKGRVDSAIQKKFGITSDAIRPYHYQDFFFQEVQEVGDVNMDDQLKNRDIRALVEAFYNGIGLPVTDMLKRSDLHEREGKYQHAYCMDIDRLGDVRTMCSLRNNRYWLETLMHEVGHGVYSMNIDRTLPWFLREEAHTFTTEAIAELFGSLPTNPIWLKTSAGLTADVVDAWAPALNMDRKMGLLIFCRWSLVMINFEKALYADPDQDLNALWWNLVEKYQQVKRPEGRNMPDWAAKIHLVSYPVYYHNYMLGNLLASQLLHHMADKVVNHGDINTLNFSGDRRLGNYLKEKIFAPGKALKWDELIKRATGEPLNPAYFGKDVSVQ